MKIIIEHDDSCPESPSGLHRWQLKFEELARRAKQGFETIPAMRAHVAEYVILDRMRGCDCGADAEIKKQESEATHGESRAAS